MDRILGDVAPRSAEFDCVEGLFSVWNGSYLAAGPGYVDYAYGLETSDPGPKPQVVISCRRDEETPANPVTPPTLTVDEIRLSYFSDSETISVRPKLPEEAP
jgi:hypothetical protein